MPRLRPQALPVALALLGSVAGIAAGPSAGATEPAIPTAVAPIGAATLPAALAERNWTDQQGGQDRIAAHRGERVVLLVVEARRLALAGQWAGALQAGVPGIRILTFADAPAGVRVEPARFVATLRRRVPAGVRVLPDPERLLATALALDTAEPNLLLLSANGELRQQLRGRPTPELQAAAVAALRALPTAEP